MADECAAAVDDDASSSPVEAGSRRLRSGPIESRGAPPKNGRHQSHFPRRLVDWIGDPSNLRSCFLSLRTRIGCSTEHPCPTLSPPPIGERNVFDEITEARYLRKGGIAWIKTASSRLQDRLSGLKFLQSEGMIDWQHLERSVKLACLMYQAAFCYDNFLRSNLLN
uniref:Uncharacterized protein n=1 Tax=Arundo donax TaxID=35708 RepID=A0A0A9GWR1_ARUDO